MTETTYIYNPCNMTYENIEVKNIFKIAIQLFDEKEKQIFDAYDYEITGKFIIIHTTKYTIKIDIINVLYYSVYVSDKEEYIHKFLKIK